MTVMDADDVWLPHALNTLVSRLSARPDCIGAHGLADFIDDGGRRIEPGAFATLGRRRRSGATGRIVEWPQSGDTTFETIVTGSTVFPPGVLIMRRVVYETLGGYDVNTVEGDWDLLIRATRLGPCAFIDEVILMYRRHASNFGARREMPLSTHLTLMRAFRAPENSRYHVRLLRACWRARQIDAMQQHWAALTSPTGWRSMVRHACGVMLAGGRYVRGRPGRPLRAWWRLAGGYLKLRPSTDVDV